MQTHTMTVLLEYIDHSLQFAIIAINLFYIFPVMLNAFNDPLCSKFCWHNRQVPKYKGYFIN